MKVKFKLTGDIFEVIGTSYKNSPLPSNNNFVFLVQNNKGRFIEIPADGCEAVIPFEENPPALSEKDKKKFGEYVAKELNALSDNADSYTVTVTYFKKSGKYYTEGTYETNYDQMYQIFDEVKKMAEEGRLPGLAEGSHGSDFTALVTCKSDFAFPGLVIL